MKNGKGQFSFQSQRKAMRMNVQTTAQLHSSHTLSKQCSKFSKPGFNNTWTVNFQMSKLDWENAEEPEIKLPTSAGSSKKQEFQKNIYSALLTTPKPLTVWITTNWKSLQEMGIPDHLTCPLRNLCAGQEVTVRTGHETMDWFQIGKEYVKAIYCHSAYLTYMQSTSCKMPGWMKHKLESKLPGEIWIPSDTQMISPLWQKAKKN